MQKKLTEEQQQTIMDVATKEFGEKGLNGANINYIAKCSNVSVGVIYKYYSNKEELFSACLSRSLSHLNKTLQEAVKDVGDIETTMSYLISAAITFSKKHKNEIRMYHWITTISGEKAKEYAREIETVSSKLYKELISKAKSEGLVHGDMDPGVFAFFFDNLLMMLHFSYGCDYYNERFRIYMGEDVEDKDEYVKEQLVLFLKRGLKMKM
ncbi:MAG: TetR/AcrR family transcriptional regulator [Lachnospiraceae bacterium]|nr:TetR/AcrR family transcriptional regulator [Lachnospiraceae bacterium]